MELSKLEKNPETKKTQFLQQQRSDEEVNLFPVIQEKTEYSFNAMDNKEIRLFTEHPIGSLEGQFAIEKLSSNVNEYKTEEKQLKIHEQEACSKISSEQENELNELNKLATDVIQDWKNHQGESERKEEIEGKPVLKTEMLTKRCVNLLIKLKSKELYNQSKGATLNFSNYLSLVSNPQEQPTFCTLIINNIDSIVSKRYASQNYSEFQTGLENIQKAEGNTLELEAAKAAYDIAKKYYPEKNEEVDALIDQEISLNAPILKNSSSEKLANASKKIKEILEESNIVSIDSQQKSDLSKEIFDVGINNGEDSSDSQSNVTKAIQPFWPKNDGFLNSPKIKYLLPGEIIMRYGGSDYSRFFTPNNTGRALLSLSPDSENDNIRRFEVKKATYVMSGVIAPHFNQLGTGEQYVTPVGLKMLLDSGFLEELSYEKLGVISNSSGK